MDPFTLMVGFNKKFGVVLILQTEIKLKSELKRKFEFFLSLDDGWGGWDLRFREEYEFGERHTHGTERYGKNWFLF